MIPLNRGTDWGQVPRRENRAEAAGAGAGAGGGGWCFMGTELQVCRMTGVLGTDVAMVAQQYERTYNH